MNLKTPIHVGKENIFQDAYLMHGSIKLIEKYFEVFYLKETYYFDCKLVVRYNKRNVMSYVEHK
jgi:hypothetical protein